MENILNDVAAVEHMNGKEFKLRSVIFVVDREGETTRSIRRPSMYYVATFTSDFSYFKK
jgi:hypothetical protein